MLVFTPEDGYALVSWVSFARDQLRFRMFPGSIATQL